MSKYILALFYLLIIYLLIIYLLIQLTLQNREWSMLAVSWPGVDVFHSREHTGPRTEICELIYPTLFLC